MSSLYLKCALRSALRDDCVEHRSKKGKPTYSPGQRPGYGSAHITRPVRAYFHNFIGIVIFLKENDK